LMHEQSLLSENWFKKMSDDGVDTSPFL